MASGIEKMGSSDLNHLFLGFTIYTPRIVSHHLIYIMITDNKSQVVPKHKNMHVYNSITCNVIFKETQY